MPQNVYLTIPSKRPAAEVNRTLALWRNQGYRIAIWRDPGDEPVECDLLLQREAYPGYARAVNALCAAVLETDPSCDWCISAGDDTEPDPNHTADEIARQCTEHFGGTLGIMQPTGNGHGIETICGSPWMGREWCERGYSGYGPLCDAYVHNFVDNDLQEVAKLLGILWQRPDLSHIHNNWMWTTGIRPTFLDEAYSQRHWDKYKRIYENRRAAGFPGHQLLEATVSA